MTEASVHAVEIAIVVRDLGTMSHFFGEGVGLTQLDDCAIPGGLMRRYRCGDAVIRLLLFDDAPTSSNPRGGLYGASGMRCFTLVIDDISSVIRRCEACGASVVVPLQERDASLFTILEDPEGNWLELVEHAVSG